MSSQLSKVHEGLERAVMTMKKKSEQAMVTTSSEYLCGQNALQGNTATNKVLYYEVELVDFLKASLHKIALDVGANLCIANLDPDVDEKLLYDTFSAFGVIVTNPKIRRDPEIGNSRGFGFISYDSFEASDSAIEAMNEQYLCNRQITVSYAYTKDTKGERHGAPAEADRSLRLVRGHEHRRNLINKYPKKLKMIKHFDFDINPTLDSSNVQPYSVSSPYALPPYESLAPIPLPENNPPFCVYPSPSTPSTSIPSPTGYQFSPPPPSYYYTPPVVPPQEPPPSPTSIIPGPPESLPTPTPEIVSGPPSPMPGSPEPILNPPIIFPGPPESLPTPTPEIVSGPPSQMPGSPEPILNPPIIFPGPPGSTISPPYFEPSPPFYIPSPTGSIIPSPTGSTVPSPTVFQPPVVYPPPSVPPPPNTAPIVALWCVAKASVPDPIIQEAMNYACVSGADCSSIQPNGPCFEPNTVFAHASYAFNSLWQRTRAAGGTCEFGGTAILVTVDPSYEGCRFVYY